MVAENDKRLSQAGLLRHGRMWAKGRDVAYYMLWFEYLKISPSYELARRKRGGSWTAADEAQKPADFDAVLTVYDDLGDIRSLSFKDWWRNTAIDFFGYQGAKPAVTRIGELRHNTDHQADKAVANVKAHLDGPWQNQGEPTTIVLAIPVGLPKAQIAKQVAALLEKHSVKAQSSGSNSPKYSLHGRKLDSKSLFKYLMCVWIKAKFQKTALWRIGVHAKVSSTYSGRLDPNVTLNAHQQIEDRNALKILTSRAISRGILIAENAARGRFPTYAKVNHATAPDWEDMRLAVKRRVELDRVT